MVNDSLITGFTIELANKRYFLERVFGLVAQDLPLPWMALCVRSAVHFECCFAFVDRFCSCNRVLGSFDTEISKSSSVNYRKGNCMLRLLFRSYDQVTPGHFAFRDI